MTVQIENSRPSSIESHTEADEYYDDDDDDDFYSLDDTKTSLAASYENDVKDPVRRALRTVLQSRMFQVRYFISRAINCPWQLITIVATLWALFANDILQMTSSVASLDAIRVQVV